MAITNIVSTSWSTSSRYTIIKRMFVWLNVRVFKWYSWLQHLHDNDASTFEYFPKTLAWVTLTISFTRHASRTKSSPLGALAPGLSLSCPLPAQQPLFGTVWSQGWSAEKQKHTKHTFQAATRCMYSLVGPGEVVDDVARGVGEVNRHRCDA